MLRMAYHVLDSFLQRPAWRAHEAVVTAVCEVYSHVMCAVKVRLWCAVVRQSAIRCVLAVSISVSRKACRRRRLHCRTGADAGYM